MRPADSHGAHGIDGGLYGRSQAGGAAAGPPDAPGLLRLPAGTDSTSTRSVGQAERTARPQSRQTLLVVSHFGGYQGEPGTEGR